MATKSEAVLNILLIPPGPQLFYRITTLLLVLRHKGASLFLTCYRLIKQHAEFWTILISEMLTQFTFSPLV